MPLARAAFARRNTHFKALPIRALKLDAFIMMLNRRDVVKNVENNETDKESVDQEDDKKE